MARILTNESSFRLAIQYSRPPDRAPATRILRGWVGEAGKANTATSEAKPQPTCSRV